MTVPEECDARLESRVSTAAKYGEGAMLGTIRTNLLSNVRQYSHLINQHEPAVHSISVSVCSFTRLLAL